MHYQKMTPQKMILGKLFNEENSPIANILSKSFYKDPDEQKILDHLQTGSSSFEGLYKKYGLGLVIKAMQLANRQAEHEILKKWEKEKKYE